MSGSASLNHIFRSVWNQSLGAMVAVAEIASARGGSGGSRVRSPHALRLPALAGTRPGVLSLGIAVAWGALLPAALANPAGGVAIHGQATFNTSQPNHLQVTTQNGALTNHSAINWQSFSIPAGSTTHFQQPNAASLVINRVVTPTPSAIFGTLSSNGQLVLVNQAGIAVGAGALVDTAGFTASVLGLSEADARAARLRFGTLGGLAGTPGINVQGHVVARGGDVVLIAPQIETGEAALIQAPGGSTILAAGRQVEITGRGLEGIVLQVQAPADQAINLGSLQGDAVGVFAGTLKHSGSIEATAITVEGGRIMLKAADQLEVNGTVRAQGLGGQGGAVHATAKTVLLDRQAVIDVSGASGGGEALIGGGWQGHDARVANASQTVVATGVQIRADATGNGDGGTAVVWADGATRFGGFISARGGVNGGNGGLAEVSGKQTLDFRGTADLRAPMGRAGTLLLDPATLTIGTTADLNGDGTGVDVTLSPTVVGTTINGSQITALAVEGLLNSGNLSLSATGNISVDAAITKTGTSVSTLSLRSSIGNISINNQISSSSGSLNVSLTADGGQVTVSNPISTFGGSVVIAANNDIALTPVFGNSSATGITAGSVTMTSTGGSISTGSGYSISAAGPITLQVNTALTLLGTSLTSQAANDAVVLKAGGVMNVSGYGGAVNTPNGRALAYVNYGPTHSFGLISPMFKQYNFTTGAPVLGSGNGVIYTNSTPAVLTSTLTSAVTKVYDGQPAIDLSGASIATPTGVLDGYILTGATFTLGSGNLIDKNVGVNKGVTEIGIAVTGIIRSLDGINSLYGYRLNATGAGVTAKALTASYTGANKVYDGLTGASVAGSSADIIGADAVTFSQSASFDTKNVGTGKTINVSAIALGGTDAGNYALQNTTATATANITPRAISVTGITASDKVYDGLTTAPVTTSAALLTGKISGDDLSIASATGNFGDKNVGVGKVVAISNLVLAGADAGNYTIQNNGATSAASILVRPLSTWVGSGGGQWSLATNWDAIPDGSNVLAVAIPAGAGTVLYDATAGSTILDSLTSTRALTMSGGSLQVNNSVNASGFNQTGGALGGAGQFAVNGSFSQSGGSIAMAGIDITQVNGNLTFSNLRAPTISLVAQNGAIAQTGSLVSAALNTRSTQGTVLNNSGNQVASWRAANVGSGAIELTNVGVLDIQGINNASGNITVVNTGGIFTSGAVTAPAGIVSMTANSPLTIGSSGLLAGGNIFLNATNLTSAGNMTLLGNVTSTAGAISLFAGNNFVQNGTVQAALGITASAGGSMTFGPFAMSLGSPISYTQNGGVPVAAPGTGPGQAGSSVLTESLVNLISEVLESRDDDQQADPLLSANDRYDNKDAIFSEGQICRP